MSNTRKKFEIKILVNLDDLKPLKNCNGNYPGEPAMRWRFDGKCGSKYQLPDKTPAECDPDGKRPCCSQLSGACGNTTKHCSCVDCIDYREVKKWREAGRIWAEIFIVMAKL